jgi:hypothetical protein
MREENSMFLRINCKLSRGWVLRLVDVIPGCGASNCVYFNLGLGDSLSKLDNP